MVNSFTINALKTIYATCFKFGIKKYERNHSQLTFTCSKSAIETLENDVKYVQN